ncbi:hypothetical protein G6L30_08120 [Agrobacterium rhizogenes]|nr:hypothetical protein [Rhizobium rhizogenes]
MTIEALIDALQKAQEPNRWLDAKIDAAMRVGTIKMHKGGFEWAWDNFPVWAHHAQARGMCGVQHSNGDLGLIWDSLPFTDSVDAALALLDHALPGWFWRVGHGSVEDWAHINRVHPDHCDKKDEAHGIGASPAIALCIAILKAKQALEVPG